MANNLMVIRATGNAAAINSLLPVFESPELTRVKEERDWYKMKVEMQEPRRKADFARGIENARNNYVVRRPYLPVRMMLGSYGLLVSIVVGFFKGVENISNTLVHYKLQSGGV